ncbi:MAG TPA: VOC family protein [Rubrobacteraceae bacterium]|nr:VOC family protein [Rubrobacteraceae bacterium]
MGARGLTHVSVHAYDLEESAPRTHHFGVDVDDFEAAYKKVGELGVGVGSGYHSKVYQLPDGAVQLYVRDPAGNMVEINWPDIATLDRSVVTHVEKVAGRPDARLYLRD